MEAHTFLKSLLNWRKSSKPVHDGQTVHFAPQQNVYVYLREYGNDQVLVILNRNE
jgi:glycosidase